MGSSPPLHHCHTHKLWGLVNRVHSFLHFIALITIVYYRVTFFSNKHDPKYSMVSSLPWVIIFGAELFLSFIWILTEPMHWFPVTRTVFPERLPKDADLPGIDVFVFTADPEREPTFNVMNTVISAMALDYPAEKLSVYLSDDGGAPVTLMGIKEAWGFATWWLPFCRRWNVKAVCPRAYFEGPEEDNHNIEFIQHRNKIKEKYVAFKERVQKKWRVELQNEANRNARNHLALIQVINANLIEDDDASVNPEKEMMPLLVYVAREKKASRPHNFKAGAINVLLRVSSIMSNSPYILVLDCDMFCNDSISARQTMCFYIDPRTPRSLGWVQYPHKFHNISDSDIYDSQMRTVWTVYFPGMDGLKDLLYLAQIFTSRGKHCMGLILMMIGFRYGSVTEDIMTGLYLQHKGWRSFYLNPTRPQFLGTATTNLNEALVQGIRWYAGMLDISLSKNLPLIYGPSRMQFLQKLSNSWISLFPADVLIVLCLGIIPPLCFLYGIPLYPKVSDPFFTTFALVFIPSRLKGIYAHYISGGSINTWLNEQRIWLVKSVTCTMYGALNCIMVKLGLREASFIPTNKDEGKDKTKFYEMGKYDFRTSNMFLVPLVTIVSLNLVCLIGGIIRVIVAHNWDMYLAHVIFSFYVLLMSFPVIEGMLLRSDNGHVPLLATTISSLVVFVLLSSGYLTLYYQRIAL